MKLAQIEQIDVIETIRQFFVRRRRVKLLTELRDYATYVVFRRINEDKRIAEREKRADDIRAAVFGDAFFGMPPWQRQLAYDVLKAKDDGYDVQIVPIR